MDTYADFKYIWNDLYEGDCDADWLATVCPPQALFRNLDEEYCFVRHVRMEDHDFFEEFSRQYGCDALYIWTNWHHWKDDAGYSQPSFGELRDFVQEWEPMVNCVARGKSTIDTWKDINDMDTTPTSKDINQVLEMCSIEVKVRKYYPFFFLRYITAH